jgi:hypothetical protein
MSAAENVARLSCTRNQPGPTAAQGGVPAPRCGTSNVGVGDAVGDADTGNSVDDADDPDDPDDIVGGIGVSGVKVGEVALVGEPEEVTDGEVAWPAHPPISVLAASRATTVTPRARCPTARGGFISRLLPFPPCHPTPPWVTRGGWPADELQPV